MNIKRSFGIAMIVCLITALFVIGAFADQQEQSPVEERDVLVVYFSATGTAGLPSKRMIRPAVRRSQGIRWIWKDIQRSISVIRSGGVTFRGS